MANSQAKYIMDDEGLAFARVGFPVYDRVGYQRRAIIGWGVGSILSIGLRTRFRTMRTRRDRDMVLFGTGGGLIRAVLCGGGGFVFL